VAVQPKSGVSGTAVVPMTPRPAMKAETAKPGGMASYTGSSVKPRPVHLKPVVLKSKPKKAQLESAPPPAKQQSTTTKPRCAFKSINVLCGHAPKRKCEITNNGLLEVVPREGAQSRKGKIALFGVELEASYKTGGQDIIIVKTACDNKCGGKRQICVKKGTAPPSEGEWKQAQETKIEVQSAKADRIWPSRVTPDSWAAYGRCEERSDVRMATIHVFPHAEFEGSIDFELFSEYYDKFNELLEAFKSKTFGGGLVHYKPIKSAPSGSLRVRLGWEEDDDYRVFYRAEISLGGKNVVPLFNVGCEIQAKVSELARVAGPIAGVAGWLLGHVADAFAFVTLRVETEIRRGLTAKYFPSRDEWEFGTQVLEFGVSGLVDLGLGAIFGNPRLVSYEVRCQGETGISGSGTVEISGAGVVLDTKVEIGGLMTSVVIKKTAFDVEEKSDNNEGSAGWSILDPWDVSYPIWLLRADKK